MQNKKEIKDQVAKAAGFCDWLELITLCTADMISAHADTAIDLYAEQWRPRTIHLIGGRNINRTAELVATIAHMSPKDIIIHCQSDADAKNVALRLGENIRRLAETIKITQLNVECFKENLEVLKVPKTRNVIPDKYQKPNLNHLRNGVKK